MKIIKSLVVLSFLFWGIAFTQPVYLADDFEDGNLDGWSQRGDTAWAASTADPITGSYSLKHNLSDSSGGSHIHRALDSLRVDTTITTWRFNLRSGNFDPSNENKFWVYLMVHDTTSVNGYAVGVNLEGESDTLTLWRVTGSSAAGVVIQSSFNWGEYDLLGIEVTRDSLGVWEMKYDTTGGFDQLMSAGVGKDDYYLEANYFGMSFYFKTSRAGQLWMDDITVKHGHRVYANLFAFLQGPFDADTMKTELLKNDYIPLQQPYGDSSWAYSGAEYVETIPDSVVDWVMVELRTGTGPETKVASRAAFIKSSGKITDTNAGEPVSFSGVSDGDYYIVLHHRNHLAIMSATAQSLSAESAAFDFSSSLDQTYGSNAMAELSTGIYGMYTGDANADGQIATDDKNDIWKIQTGEAGYLSSDFNLDGQSATDDKNDYWKLNTGLGTQVPQ